MLQHSRDLQVARPGFWSLKCFLHVGAAVQRQAIESGHCGAILGFMEGGASCAPGRVVLLQ
jgi:hypothetical protein